MKLLTTISIVLFLAVSATAQKNQFDRISFLFGEWEGTGSGFGNNRSKITASYRPVMNGVYIDVKHDSRFEPTAENPLGEHHTDQGFISLDKARQVFVFRQFNNEGYINQYVLVDSLSSEEMLVFQTENIENFVPGGSAKWTIEKKSDAEIETNFYVSFPGREAKCFGTNKMFRK